MRTLFLAWQDKHGTKAWFPIGRLDADVTQRLYRFRYVHGAVRAKQEVRFRPLLEFPEMEKAYESRWLFPMFTSRAFNKARPDFADYVDRLELSSNADPIQILTANGGRRVTDAYEVFPKLDADEDGHFKCRFLVHGSRYVNAAAQARIKSLKIGEPLQVSLELNNPATVLAVQLQTHDYHLIGWAPRYLIADLSAELPANSNRYSASVVRINLPPAPISQRILVELQGQWKEHRPMQGKDFEPLVALAT